MKISGIYEIVNKANGKKYIGSSVNIKDRFNRHKRELNKGIHSNQHLQHAWDEYGCDNFDFGIIEILELGDLLLLEQKYLDKCKDNPDLFYNMSYDAVATMRGIKHSDEYKEKLSKSHLGILHSEETKKKMSLSHTGIKRSEEIKRKISKNHALYWKGKRQSEESNRKRSETLKKRFASLCDKKI